MRLVLVLALSTLAAGCKGQDVAIRTVELPPPTTFAGLEQLKGPIPSGPCTLPSVSLSIDSLKPITLGDSATLLFPVGWHVQEPYSNDHEHTETQLAAPGDGRALIERQRNGATSRRFLMYANVKGSASPIAAEGTTCSLARGQAGAIWTFYRPHPQDTHRRKYTALGSIITPEGSWYSVMLSAASAADQSQLASILSEVMLLPAPTVPATR